MKKLKASFKKLTGLKLSDPKHKFWIRYFTVKYPKSAANITPPFSSQIQSFSFETIPSKSLYIHAKEIEENPENILPGYLKFDQQIGLDYFEFCQTFLADKNLLNKKAILSLAEPHLIRFSIAFFHQFYLKFQYLLNNEDAPLFPIWFLEKYSMVHTVIFMCKDEIISDFILYVLTPILEYIQMYTIRILSTPDGSPIRSFVEIMINHLINYFSNTEKPIEPYFYPCISFISLYCSRVVSGNFFNDANKSILEKSLKIFTSNKIRIDSPKTESNIMAFIMHELFFLSKQKSEVFHESIIKSGLNNELDQNHSISDPNNLSCKELSYYDIGKMILQYFYNLNSLEIKSAEPPFLTIDLEILSKALLDFLKASFKVISQHPFKQKQSEKTDLILGANLYENPEFDFIEQDLVKVDFHKKTEKKTFEEFPLSLNVNKTIPELFYLFKQLMEKHPNFASSFCKVLFSKFSKKTELSHYLFIIFVSKFLPGKILCHEINENSLWTVILSDNAFTELEKYEKDFICIIEELIIKCFSSFESNQILLIETLSNILLTPNIDNILCIIEQLLVFCPQKFCEQIRHSSLIDTLYHVDSNFKYTLVHQASKNLNAFVQRRSRITGIIKNICQYSVVELVEPKTRCSYIISLLFEVSLQDLVSNVISYALTIDSVTLLVVEEINRYFCASITKIKDRNWKIMVQKVFSAICSSVDKSRKDICEDLIKTSYLLILHKMVQSTDDFEFSLSILSFITNLCNSSSLFLRELSNPIWCFQETWKDLFLKNTIQLCDLQILWRFTLLGDDSLIRNVEGLKLLISVSKKSKYFKDVCSELASKCKYSLINRFHCSQADIGISILDVFEDIPEYVNLLKIVGSSFFTPNEFKVYLHKIQMKNNLKLLQVFSDIIQLSSTNDMTSFFHIDKFYTNFKVGPVRIDSKPNISFFVRFDKPSEKGSFEFVSIYLNGIEASFSIKLIDLQPILKYNNSSTNTNIEVNTNKKLASLKWLKMNIFINKKHISINVDNQAFCELKFPPLINLISLTFLVKNVACDIEKITFYDNSLNSIACYSARVIENSICPNISQSNNNSFGDAEFNGFYVPYTVCITNTISNCGGINVILPLFEISKTDPLILLKSVLSITKNNEQMLVERSFFRALSDILPSKMKFDVIQCLCDIYRVVKTTELRTELLVNIFGNWNILQKLSSEYHDKYIQTILPIVLGSDPNLFTKFFNVREFFSSTILENLHIWNLIDKFSSFKFSDEDFVSLLSAATDSKNPSFTLNALKALSTALNKHDNGIELLRKFDYYSPFFKLFETYLDNEEIWLNIFEIFSVISKQKPESQLSLHILSMLPLLNLEKITEKSLDLIISLIFSHQKSAKVQFIENPHFLPLICFFLPCFPQRSEEISQLIYNSLNVYDISRKNIVNCIYWPLWLLFLSLFQNDTTKIDDWILMIAKASFPNDQATLEEIEIIFLIFSTVYQLDFSKMILLFFKHALIYRNSSIIVLETIKFLFYSPKMDKIQINSELMRDLTQLSKFVVNVPIPTPIFNSSLNSNPSQEDFEIIKLCIAAALKNKELINKEIPLFEQSDISISSTLLLLIHRIVIENAEIALVFLEKINEILSSRHSKLVLNILYNDFKENENATILLNKYLSGNIMENSQEELENLLKVDRQKYQKHFDEIKQNVSKLLFEHLEEIYTTEKLRLNQLNMNLPKFDEMIKENCESLARLSRQNHRIWTTISLKLVESGAIWNATSSEGLHWKLDDCLDSFGRRMKTKVNRHFNNHKDASLARDSSTGAETIKRTFFGQNEIVNDIGAYLEKLRNSIFKLDCTLVTVKAYYKGTIYFTSNSLSFESIEVTDEFGQKKESRPKMVEIFYENIKFLMKRRFLHQKIGAEVFTDKRSSYFFIFEDNKILKTFIGKMKSVGCKKLSKIDEFTSKWKTGKISNYEYIYWLNMFSGRSFNDIAQYPVFPWVLTNYSSDVLDLFDTKNYRNLSKPIGALNEERLENLKAMYQELTSNEIGVGAPSLYRLHYSSPGFVTYFLIRCEPFTTLHIALQSGRFDHPGRLFCSIEDSFASCVSLNNDFRELIPEFYSTCEFLLNSNNFDLGKGINDVVLPKWAKSPSLFIALNRLALESPIVSSSLNEWIDLIFGFKQQDIQANNLFHNFSDPSYFDKCNPDEKDHIMTHAANFGVNPSKLFSQSHPKRIPPFSPDFRNSLRIVPILRYKQFKPMKLWCTQNEMMAILLPGTLMQAQLDVISGNNNNLSFRLVSKFGLNFPMNLATTNIIDKFTKILEENNSFVVSNPWSQVFDVIDVSRHKEIFTSTEHQSTITAIAADHDFVISSSQDTSLCIWSISKKRMNSHVHAHNHKINCIDYNYDMDLIASVDKIGVFSYSSAINSIFIRSIKLERIPKNILISTLGFTILFYEERNLMDVTSIIETYDLSQRIVEVCKVPGSITSSCLCEFPDRSQYLFISMSTLKIFMHSVTDLTRRAVYGEVESEVCISTFSKERNELFLSLANGNLLSYQFGL
ncbi:hypothetical protein TRFO_04329 [Tritrichomonas foetus]|uniref:Beige/BEACH domain containing protein n=1 Tax=Tritrichomonas foetus TaxID=1144522 RepID=A0A1J4KKC8_9EUKA|nr:hypothetical protein TRFO_04329 [Tritrichomonas foetus]|eukprot:OHT10292.1 hypothetical protein TRFO_04329 [Tritrichomonas foetus]